MPVIPTKRHYKIFLVICVCETLYPYSLGVNLLCELHVVETMEHFKFLLRTRPSQAFLLQINGSLICYKDV